MVWFLVVRWIIWVDSGRSILNYEAKPQGTGLLPLSNAYGHILLAHVFLRTFACHCLNDRTRSPAIHGCTSDAAGLGKWYVCIKTELEVWACVFLYLVDTQYVCSLFPAFPERSPWPRQVKSQPRASWLLQGVPFKLRYEMGECHKPASYCDMFPVWWLF